MTLEEARTELAAAEAHLNDVANLLALGTYVSAEIRRSAASRVFEARHALDEVRCEALGVAAIGGRPVCTNDPDDMVDALSLAADRLVGGEDPNAGLELGPADCLPRTGSFW